MFVRRAASRCGCRRTNRRRGGPVACGSGHLRAWSSDAAASAARSPRWRPRRPRTSACQDVTPTGTACVRTPGGTEPLRQVPCLSDRWRHSCGFVRGRGWQVALAGQDHGTFLGTDGGSFMGTPSGMSMDTADSTSAGADDAPVRTSAGATEGGPVVTGEGMFVATSRRTSVGTAEGMAGRRARGRGPGSGCGNGRWHVCRHGGSDECGRGRRGVRGHRQRRSRRRGAGRPPSRRPHTRGPFPESVWGQQDFLGPRGCILFSRLVRAFSK